MATTTTSTGPLLVGMKMNTKISKRTWHIYIPTLEQKQWLNPWSSFSWLSLSLSPTDKRSMYIDNCENSTEPLRSSVNCETSTKPVKGLFRKVKSLLSENGEVDKYSIPFQPNLCLHAHFQRYAGDIVERNMFCMLTS